MQKSFQYKKKIFESLKSIEAFSSHVSTKKVSWLGTYKLELLQALLLASVSGYGTRVYRT